MCFDFLVLFLKFKIKKKKKVRYLLIKSLFQKKTEHIQNQIVENISILDLLKRSNLV